MSAAEAPLSFAQQRLWVIDAAAPGSVTYNVPLLLHWREPVNPDALGVALTALVTRHEVLRTTYHLRDGGPVQVVGAPEPVKVDVVAAIPDLDVRSDAERRGREPFDLTAGPMVRCVLWQGAPDGDTMLLCVHHIAIDGWSLAPLLTDLELAYSAALAGESAILPDPPLRYADFARTDLAAFDETAVRKRADQLKGIDPALTLAGARQTAVLPEGDRPGEQHLFALPADVWSGVTELARTLRATPFVVLLAAYQAVLHRWSGRTELLVGAVAANRPSPELETLVGFFVNTVPLHCTVNPQWTFAELCTASRSEAFRSLSHQRLPFDQLARHAGGLRLSAGFAMQNMPAAHHDRWEPPVVLGTGTAKFDLLLIIEETPAGVLGTLEFDTDRYSTELCAAIAANLVELLTVAAGAPDTLLSEFSLTGAPDRVTAVEPARAERAVPVVRTDVPSTETRWAADLFTEALAELGLAARPDAASNFFTMGGHSMLAVTMLARAQRKHGIAVSPRDFLGDPTVAGLGRLLATGATAAPRQTAADRNPAADRHPATSAQQRFWFLDRISALRTAYLVPSVVEYAGSLDPAALRRAVDRVLAHHPALTARFELDRKARSVFYRTDGAPAVATVVDATDWSAAELAEHVSNVCWTGFNLATDAPARAEIITCGPQRTLLVVVAHHIVFDGWSRDLLVDQIAAAYRADAPLPDAVHPAELAEPDVQAADEVLAGFAGAPTDVVLPHDRPRPEIQSTTAASVVATVDPDTTAALHAVTKELGCSTFTAVAAVLGVTLARRSGQRDFLFAFPWAGREGAGSAEAIGMFVSTLLLRVDLRDNPTWRELLIQVGDSAKCAFRNASVPYDAIVAALHPDRDLSRPPVTPVYLSAQDGIAEPMAPDGTAARYLPLEPLHIKYEIELTAMDSADGLGLSLSYATELFDARTTDGLMTDLLTAAADLAWRSQGHPVGGTQ